MMRVAILNPQANFSKVEKGWPQKPDFGGQLIYVRELANALSKLNVRVDIITRKFRLEGWSDYNESASFINENLRILRLPCGPSGFVPKESLWPYLEEWKQQIVDHYYREEEFPHVCSAHYADGGYVGYLIKEELSIPFTFTSHSLGGPKIDKLLESGELPHEFLKKYRFDKRILAESISIQTATKIVASTDLEIENQYGHPLYEPEHLSNKEKFSKVSPGINHNFFSQNELLNEKIILTNILDKIQNSIHPTRWNYPCVICSSRPDPKKNYDNLIKAWATNSTVHNTFNLILIGSEFERPIECWDINSIQNPVIKSIWHIVEENTLFGSVATLSVNGQKELGVLYRFMARQRQGVFIMPSLFEPFGLGPLEALACGLPSLVTDQGGTKEVFESFVAKENLFVSPKDINSITSAILKMNDNQAVWEDQHRLGSEFVQDHFNWSKTAESYIKIFEECHMSSSHGDTQTQEIDSLEENSKSRIDAFVYDEIVII